MIVGVCLAVGAALFWIGAFFVSKGSMDNSITEIGAFLFGVGLVIFGATLLSKPFQFAEKEMPSQQSAT
jgi:drug/metabolite transporter (DMT)-like permease